MSKIKVVKIDCVTKALEEFEIERNLFAYYKLIDCRMIEGVPVDLAEVSVDGTVNEVYVDEEFMYTPKPGGFYFEGGQPMLGNGMIVGVDLEEGDFVDHKVDLEKMRNLITFISAEQAAVFQQDF